MRGQEVIEAFTRRFGEPPEFLIRAPGRVNLIGEHTDYNDGLVLPLAIDRCLWLAGRTSSAATVRLESLDREGSVRFGLGDAQPAGPTWPGWGAYVWAVADLLVRESVREEGGRLGIEAVIASEIPVGAGLSSSAALELATARALQAAWGDVWDGKQMSLLCHRAENEGVGVSCGVMDQMIVATAREGCALLIDCRSLECSPIRMPEDLVVAVLDTGTRRDLEASAFNERRRECEAAAAALGVASLSDVDLESLLASGLADQLVRRARHVVTENQRVVDFARALERGESARLGALMAESQRSLREDYDVVTPALDAIVEVALELPGTIGARMTGAGFGGCAVALLERASAPEFAEALEAGYARRSGLRGRVHLCEAAAGVSLEQTGATDRETP